jgi:tellurite resistance protein TerC
LNEINTANIDFSPTLWIVFNLFVLAMLALDLGVFNRKAHAVKFKEALSWSVVWIALAMAFNFWLYKEFGKQVGHEFLAGYLLEKSLSVDNIFVFVMIFGYFNVAPKYQHRLLFWGILGALILRGIMIAAGAALIANFYWVLYVFGALLVFTGIKMAFHDPAEGDPSKGWVYRMGKRLLPMAPPGDYGQKFVVKVDGKTFVTPMFLVLLVVETTDVLFAIDSIPAIFGVTQNTFIVYTSNVFAILGLRALYFLLAGVIDMFRYLKYGLSLVLIFVGIKMLLGHSEYKIPINISLIVIGSILALSIIASIIAAKFDKHPEPPRDFPDDQAIDPTKPVGAPEETGHEPNPEQK